MPPLDSPVDPSRLAPEHEIGWTLDQLRVALARLDGTDDELAMVELEISPARDSLIACHAALAIQVGPCTEDDRNGRRLRRFQAQLTNDPAEDARSVQRA